MHFIRISSSNFPEMRPLSTFWSLLSNSCHGNGHRYKTCSFDFRCVYCTFYDCAKFHYDHITGRKLLQIKILKFLCSGHLDKYLSTEANNMVHRSVQVVDHVVENSNKSTSNQRLVPYKVLTGKGITLKARDSAVHEDHASKINSHKFNYPAIQFLTYQKQKSIKFMNKI